jgi:glycosyltransferase involved in cell wall biosynthesis
MVALSRMRRRDGVSVKIVGEGDFSDELRALIASLGLQDVVHFDNHMYPVQEMPRILADCDVGLVPLQMSSITTYALPLKLLEYLSLGMPSITVRNVAIAHYFGEDDCFYYDAGDAESLRAVLDRLAADPALVRKARARAAVLRSRFSWSGESRKYVALLRSLAGETSPIAHART